MLIRSVALTLLAPCIVAATSAQNAPAAPHKTPDTFKIVLVGDSTVATEGGWGPAFCAALTPNVICVDTAKNGRSSRSFIAEGLWAKALAEKGQYYFIQFGHNDGKPDLARRTDPETAFAANLKRYIDEARAIGATPVLVSPLSRRNYVDGKLHIDDLREYAAAMRRVASEQKVPFIDLYALSTHLLEGMTQQEADAFDATAHPDAAAENPGPAKPDRTHLNDQGKAVFGKIVAEETARVIPELRPSIRAEAKPTATKLPRVTVAPKGKADFHTLREAIDHAPKTGETIFLGPGTYRQKIQIDIPNIHLIGTGQRPQDVILSWNDSAASAGGTGKSGTVSVTADGFEAENLTIENTWENENTRSEQGSQAVALLLNSDRAVLDRVRLLGAQDTLYANSRTCHDALPSDGTPPTTPQPPCQASRQYFHDCFIEGHVDYIFGDAKAVFDSCELHSRHHPTVMLTAQSRHYPEEDSGYTFLHCRITGDDNGDRVVLGRPWRDFSTVLFYDTDVEQPLDPAGWSDWAGRLKTSTYREYRSHGPGVNCGHRIVPYPDLTAQEEQALTPRKLLAGRDAWDPALALEGLRASQLDGSATSSH